MQILALDTSTEACSAALFLDGDVRERFELAFRRHGELILPMVEALLAESGHSLRQLDGLAFGRGPGSFTGVRIAAGVAQGLAFGADLPVAPVSSLCALAQGRYRERGTERVLAAFDARMEEVYWAACVADEQGIMAVEGGEQVCKPQAVPLPAGNDWAGAGPGWEAYDSALRRRLGDQIGEVDSACYPHARDVAAIGARMIARGKGVGAEQALPVYLRDKVAERKRG